MMRVWVKLFAGLRRFAPQGSTYGKPFEVQLPEGAVLGELVHLLQLPPQETKVAFVNGRAREMDWRLETEDEIGIFPPIAGG